MSATGQWDCVMKTPLGDHKVALTIDADENEFGGEAISEFGPMTIANGKVSGDTLVWSAKLQNPVEIGLDFKVTVTGDTMSGQAKTMLFGSFPINGKRRT